MRVTEPTAPVRPETYAVVDREGVAMTGDLSYMELSALSTGLLIGRLVVGLGMAAHGAQKLFGWFGGKGIPGTALYLESLGYHPGRPFAIVAGSGEFLSGVLVAVGLLGPIGPGLMLSVMLVAMCQQFRNGFFAMNGGLELPLLYGTAAVALAFTGFGQYALDRVLGLHGLSRIPIEALALVIGALGGATALALRRPQARVR
jgi:putative oxidoreductase